MWGLAAASTGAEPRRVGKSSIAFKGLVVLNFLIPKLYKFLILLLEKSFSPRQFCSK